MAKTKKPITKAFIDIGKVPIANDKGQVEQQQEYVVVDEDLAKYMGAKYTTKTPDPVTITKKGGKSYKREISVTPTGIKYKLGFIEGVDPKTKNLKVKWVTIRIPRGAKLRTYIAALRILVKKKPSYLKMPPPSNKVTRLFDAK